MSDENQTEDAEAKAPKWHEKLSQKGRETLAEGQNPRSMTDEDYAVWAKHNRKLVEGVEDLAHNVHPDEDDEDEDGS